MMKADRNAPGSVLEYSFLTVQPERDNRYAYQLGSTAAFGPSDAINLPVWTLDGKTEFAQHLKFAFPQQLTKCAIVLVASLDKPGNILPSLRKWYRVAEQEIQSFYDKKAIEEGKQAQIRFWQEYVEPVESSMHANMDTTTPTLDMDPVLVPPEPNVLVENCGASVIVVLTKSDTFGDLNDEQLNKVQYHVRQFCLHHGAALIYTSAKTDQNTQLLFKYLTHRVYSLPFTTPAYIVDKESIVVPSGWDSEQKLDIVKETLSDLDVPPLPQEERTSAREPVVEIEDEPSFAKRMETALAAAAAETSASPKREPSAGKGNAPQMGDNNSTLSSFFSNLIKNKDAPSPKSSTTHVDPQAHFQKLLNTSSQSSATSAPASRPQASESPREDGSRVLDLDEADGEPSPMGSTPRDPDESESGEK